MSTRFPGWPTSLAGALFAALAVTTVGVAQNNPPQPQRPGTPDNAAGAARQMKVGVVDIGLLFRDYKRKDVLEARVNAERERVKGVLEADAENIMRMRKQLDKAFVPNSEPWFLLRDEIKQAQFNLELKTEREQNALKKRVEEFTLQILTELETTIRTYGERHGFDLILKSDREEQTPEGGQQSELVQQFQERIFRAQISDVLFFAARIDVTENVKRLLNDKDNMDRMEQLALERERRRAAAAAAPQQQAAPVPPAPPGAPPQGQRGN